MWPIVQVQSIVEMILNCHDQLDQVLIVIEIKQDNNVSDNIKSVYAIDEIELLWPIGLGLVYDEN